MYAYLTLLYFIGELRHKTYAQMVLKKRKTEFRSRIIEKKNAKNMMAGLFWHSMYLLIRSALPLKRNTIFLQRI